MMEQFDAVILANGDYPVADVPLRILRESSFVACCDGAANAFVADGGVPDVIVGDGDSLSEDNRVRFGHLLHQLDEQDYNDLTKTVNYLASLGKHRIAIVGATGKCEDHTLGNISLLMEYMRRGLFVRMFTDHGIFIPCTDTVTFPSADTLVLPIRPGQQVSIINFGATNFSSINLRYPIYDFTSWWQGTLNECTSTSFSITATGDYLVFVNY